jgi:ribonucleoside-diphosphate reductase alpha subunit
MKIRKRDNSLEQLSIDKIIYRLKKLKNDQSLGKLSSIDTDSIALKVVSSIYDGVSSSELDEEAARISIGMTENLEFGKLASRIIISNLHKNTTECFSETMEKLYANVDLNGKHAPILSDMFIEFMRNNKDSLNELIDYSRDYIFDYFGFKTLEKSYLMKINGKVVERPQHLYLRVAIQVHIGDSDTENVKKTYELISQHFLTFASPTMFNAGSRLGNLVSCYLLGSSDSVTGIFKTMSDVAQISKLGGGIGIHINNIRSKGSKIKGTNGNSDGIIPMLKVYNEICLYINQCFTPDTWVYSKCGPKQMKDIDTNDYLITMDGSFKKVNQVIINQVNKEILEIRATNTLFPVKVTKEHELYLIKEQDKITNFSVIKNKLDKQIIKPDFYNAGELNENDLVGFPLPTYIQDNNNHDLEYYKLYGMMLGNGYHSYNEYGITLNNTENLDEQIFVKNYLDNKGVKYLLSDYIECTKITWCDTNNKIGIKKEMLYDSNNTKKFYESFLHLPTPKILKIIQGLLKTGANLKELYFSNTSQELIMQIKYLFLRLGILTSGCVKNNKTESQIAYSLQIPKHPILKSIIKFKNTKSLKYFEWNGILWGRIKSINKIQYKGDVYDFNIIDNHNYLTDMGLVHNSGKRKGSFAIYLSPEHPDILEFLDLRKNQGSDNLRARDLFYSIWMPDLFMEQVEKDGNWYLMDPDECPGLDNCYGQEYNTLYWKYVEEKKYRKVLKAQEIWVKILESQIESGIPYIVYKDQANYKSNQKNIGVIKSSNLCSEILLYSDDKEYACCNLSSIALPKYIKYDSKKIPYFDHQALFEVVKYLVLPMNNIIDYNYYPVPETQKSNISHRPIGIGTQGLLSAFEELKIPYESVEADKLNKEIWETMYYASLCGSLELSKKHGPYSTFKGSPMSEGKFQFDLWEEFNNIEIKHSGRWNWNTLRTDIIQHGIRNSTLLCQMPTASSAQIMGNSESTEPFDSCIFKRRVLSGEYVVCNKNMVKDLTKLGIWNKEVKNTIIANNGSIQGIDIIPIDIQNLYKTVWEISMKKMIDMSAKRSIYICQTQSLNLFIASPTIKKLTSMHFYGWKQHLKTGIYYLRSKPQANAAKFSIDANLEKNKKKSPKNKSKNTSVEPTNEEILACSIDNRENCELCSS